MTEHFGEINAENVANARMMCRRVVTEINNFGITEAQKLFIIYLLSLELENVDACHDLTVVAKDFCQSTGIMLECK